MPATHYRNNQVAIRTAHDLSFKRECDGSYCVKHSEVRIVVYKAPAVINGRVRRVWRIGLNGHVVGATFEGSMAARRYASGAVAYPDGPVRNTSAE